MKDYDPFDYIDESYEVVYCTDCGEACKAVEETFDYPGTHCTGGKSGTHHTGVYVSDCCGAEVSDEPQYDNSTFANHDGTFAAND